MPLTSQLISLFNISPSQQSTPSDEARPKVALVATGYRGSGETHYARDRRKSQIPTMEEEEEARPRYLYVGSLWTRGSYVARRLT